ncbi:hypothetical protein ElyMa_000540100 [Elysia marginata]|uniref:WSC domain-containing protein n=1 Tax=Elysia marginata TaxID=1093978 RepID=A0AAV4G1C2_9GAST|nr:hypothetical protein ElyMa_000540100 [Elysia marginata]
MVALLHGESCTCAKYNHLESYLAEATPVNQTCDRPCPGSDVQTCGSLEQAANKTIYSAHTILDRDNIRQSCNELYYIGLTIDGYYVINPGNATQYTTEYCNFTLHSEFRLASTVNESGVTMVTFKEFAVLN